MSQDLPTLPLKHRKPVTPEPTQVVWHVAVLSTQDLPVIKVKAAHFICHEDTGTICFYTESAVGCQTAFHKTGAYPTPVALFKSRDVLSVTRPEMVRNKINTQNWIEAVLLLEGKADLLVTPHELQVATDTVEGAQK